MNLYKTALGGLNAAQAGLATTGHNINNATTVGYNRQRVMMHTEKIYDRTLEVFRIAKTDNITTQHAAMNLAEKRLKDIANLKSRL